MAILRIRESEPLLLAGPLRDFLLEAARACDYPAPEEALAFIATQIAYPGCGLWLGAENQVLKAVSVAFWPENPLMMVPQVCVAYNVGSRALSHEIGDAVVAWVREGGYDRLRVINMTGYSDKAHMRAFRYVGDAVLVGSQLEYRLPDEQFNGRVEQQGDGEDLF